MRVMGRPTHVLLPTGQVAAALSKTGAGERTCQANVHMDNICYVYSCSNSTFFFCANSTLMHSLFILVEKKGSGTGSFCSWYSFDITNVIFEIINNVIVLPMKFVRVRIDSLTYDNSSENLHCRPMILPYILHACSRCINKDDLMNSIYTFSKLHIKLLSWSIIIHWPQIHSSITNLLIAMPTQSHKPSFSWSVIYTI